MSVVLHKPSVNSDLKTCPFCNQKRKTTNIDGQLLCTVCGCVIEKNLSWAPSYMSQLNSTSEHPYYDSSPTISNYKDSGGKLINYAVANSLKRTLQRNKINTTHDRTKLKGLLEIERLSRLLDLPTSIENAVTDKFVEFNRAGYLRNKNTYSCVAALFAIICNRANVPVAMVEILKLTVVTKKKFNQDYFYLYHLFDKASPTSANIDMHLNKYLSYVRDWPQKAKFLNTVLQCAELIGLYSKVGRSGIVHSGTLVYIFLKYYNYSSCEEVLKLLIINRLTLKNCWKNLCLDYPELKIYGGDVERGRK